MQEDCWSHTSVKDMGGEVAAQAPRHLRACPGRYAWRPPSLWIRPVEGAGAVAGEAIEWIGGDRAKIGHRADHSVRGGPNGVTAIGVTMPVAPCIVAVSSIMTAGDVRGAFGGHRRGVRSFAWSGCCSAWRGCHNAWRGRRLSERGRRRVWRGRNKSGRAERDGRNVKSAVCHGDLPSGGFAAAPHGPKERAGRPHGSAGSDATHNHVCRRPHAI